MPDKKVASTKTCFVICPIGGEGSSARNRSDKLLKYVIRAVLEARGFLVERADQLAEPGMITNQIVKRIVDCDLLIADLTDGNPNVFYELAIRHGLKRPFIHMIDSSQSIPFDNAQVRTISVDLKDLDSVDRAKAELLAQVDALESGKAITESPISIAFDLEALKTSGNTDEAMLAALFQEMSAVRSEIRDMRRSSAPTVIGKAPRNHEELLDLLVASDQHDLASLIMEKVRFHSFEPFKVSFSTTLPPAEDEKVEAQLRSFLQNATKRRWQVDVLPF